MPFQLNLFERDTDRFIRSIGTYDTYQNAYVFLRDNRGQAPFIGGELIDINVDGLYYRVNEVLDITHINLEMYHNGLVRVWMKYVPA